MRALLFLFLGWSVLIAGKCSPEVDPSPPISSKPAEKKPTNIILMIGDGMGLTQISAAMYSNGNRLHLERMPITGLHKSYSSDKLVTDSAAGATAFSCGKKTYNGAIGVDADTVSCYTLLEEAEARNMPTGMVATSTIVHATPASFIAHQPYRKLYEAIAADFLATEIDYFVGGGKKYFDRREKDDRDLLAEFTAKGYQISDYFQRDFDLIKPDPTKNFGYLTSDDDPLPVSQGRDYLLGASKKGLSHLKARDQGNGFFMMIEGSQIDWGGHANKTDYIITELLDFDATVGAVLDFAEADGNTLVVITADHETGGFAIQPGSTTDSIIGAFTSDYHTATMIPVFAYGPGSKAFSGVYENTDIYHKIRMVMEWRDLP